MFLYCLASSPFLFASQDDVELEPGCPARVIMHQQNHTVYLKENKDPSCKIKVHFLPFLPQYVLILCNTIGTPLDSKYIDIGESTRSNIFHLSLDHSPLGCLASPRPESAQRGKVKVL